MRSWRISSVGSKRRSGLIALLAGLVAVFLCALVNAEGLDGLGWILLLLLCIAPAVGCALAWAVYGVQRLCRSVKR